VARLERAAATEELLDRARQVWQIRRERCGEPPAGTPLTLVFEQIDAT
jgi:hypothetical protein